LDSSLEKLLVVKLRTAEFNFIFLAEELTVKRRKWSALVRLACLSERGIQIGLN